VDESGFEFELQDEQWTAIRAIVFTKAYPPEASI